MMKRSFKDWFTFFFIYIYVQANVFQTSNWRQFVVLFKRNMLIAYRDPTIYYLQLFLHAFYSFLIGAVFYGLKQDFGRVNDYFSGVTWIVFVTAYMHVFKVCSARCRNIFAVSLRLFLFLFSFLV